MQINVPSGFKNYFLKYLKYKNSGISRMFVGVLISLLAFEGNLVSSRQRCSSQGGHYAPEIDRISP
jgi:hypothetical protein